MTLRPALAAPARSPRSRTRSPASASIPSRCARVATSITPASETTRSSSNSTRNAFSPTSPSSCTTKVTSWAGPGCRHIRGKPLLRRPLFHPARTEPRDLIGGSRLRAPPWGPRSFLDSARRQHETGPWGDQDPRIIRLATPIPRPAPRCTDHPEPPAPTRLDYPCHLDKTDSISVPAFASSSGSGARRSPADTTRRPVMCPGTLPDHRSSSAGADGPPATERTSERRY